MARWIAILLAMAIAMAMAGKSLTDAFKAKVRERGERIERILSP